MGRGMALLLFFFVYVKIFAHNNFLYCIYFIVLCCVDVAHKYSYLPTIMEYRKQYHFDGQRITVDHSLMDQLSGWLLAQSVVVRPQVLHAPITCTHAHIPQAS
ncbi:unnamed protein product [Ceratitis capitata]|uniref:(Mediterranean fruit fly) hypothetical protein n=1 Tax=Ceratitis capitata TaxID=7213 RepID=A0A811UIB6_CERCA|nr:unnamed protein product [Ceratitis capitata]